jgi:hypothetical protein
MGTLEWYDVTQEVADRVRSDYLYEHTSRVDLSIRYGLSYDTICEMVRGTWKQPKRIRRAIGFVGVPSEEHPDYTAGRHS